MATLRSLEELARDEVEVNRLFAYDFAGDLQPKPFPPHEADWNEADRHWVEFTTRVLGSGALDRRWGRKRSGPAAERYAQFLLWVFISDPLRYCPECGGVRAPTPHEDRRVRAAAAEDLASGLERDIPPSLDDLLKVILLDLYPGAPHAAAVVAARALKVMAGVVADSGLLTRHGVTMALTALHGEMSAAQTVQRATSAIDEAVRRATSYAHYRRLLEEEAEHDEQVVWLHDHD